MKIKRHETAALLVSHPVVPAPFGYPAEPAHRCRKQFSVFAAVVYAFDNFVFRPESEHLCYHEADIVIFSGRIYPLNILALERYGLLAYDIDAFLHRLDRKICMQKCRQADVENINILFFKHFIKIGVMAFVWIVFHSLGTDVAYCDKLGVVHAFPCGDVRSAYSANADECDFQHFYLPPAQYFRRPSRINTPLYYHIFLSFYSHFRLFFNNV